MRSNQPHPTLFGAHSPATRAPRRRWRLFASIFIVYALLAPIYGSLISPAFVELLPNHGHIHPGLHPAPHLHSYETPADSPSDASDVFAIPPDNAGGLAAGLAAALAALTLLASPPALRPLPPRPLNSLVGLTPHTHAPPPRFAPLPS